MKWFTEPDGKFVIKIPTEWQYKNKAAGHKESSPYSFFTYGECNWAFQISCYSNEEKQPNMNIPVQNADTPNLTFVKSDLHDNEFFIYLWGCNVEDHFFMIKYITDKSRTDLDILSKELSTVEDVLKTLHFISPSKRNKAVNLARYENFMASLAASFDLRNRAEENNSFIELTIIIANQIDAYLRMAIVLKRQLDASSNEFDIKYLFQSTADAPMMERKIYKEALAEQIISKELFDKLEALYQERNKIVHRYIISDFKTKELIEVAVRYVEICENIRLTLKAFEDKQQEAKIGIHSEKLSDEMPEEHIRFMYSQINDKHLLSHLNREI